MDQKNTVEKNVGSRRQELEKKPADPNPLPPPFNVRPLYGKCDCRQKPLVQILK